MNSQAIVRYWHAVELLQPQAAPALKKRDNLRAPYFHDLNSTSPLPWMPGNPIARQQLPKNRVWSHTFYLHLYDSQHVASQLAALYGADEGYREPQRRQSALYALKFSEQGLLVADSLVLSSEAWFVGRALNRLDWTHGFEEAQDSLRREANSLLGGVVQPEDLAHMTALVRQALQLDAFLGPQPRRNRVRSAPINPQKPPQEDDPLNSFLLDDLACVAEALARDECSAPLAHYLSRYDPGPRLHLDQPGADLALIDRLAPSRYASGCWPAERHLGLVHSQQLAVNSLLHTLTDSSGVMGVNGPPGTGKTTLLRDLIAAVVTQRADVLASFGKASAAFLPNGRETANDGGRERFAFAMDPRLFGFEMVVASSNNGAVENVTLELPQRDKVDDSWLPDAEYFSELAELASGKPAWGLISAALGSKRKRTEFVDRVFYGKRPNNPVAPKPAEATAAMIDEDLYSADSDTENGPEQSDDEPPVQGLRQWLNDQAGEMAKLSSAGKAALWRDAVQEYQAAKADEQAIRQQVSGILEHVRALLTHRQHIRQLEQLRLDHLAKHQSLADQCHDLEARQHAPAREQLQREMQALGAHLDKKPSLLANLLSLWGAQRKWAARQRLFEGAHALAKDAFDSSQRQLQQLAAQQAEVQKQLVVDEQQINQTVHQASQQLDHARQLARLGGAEHLRQWLDQGLLGRGEQIELAEPWVLAGWREARAKVFIQALKLHRTFLRIEAKRMNMNLTFITSLLTGGRYSGLSAQALRSAWASLFMVVPVLSSTFASFARSFGSLGCGQIGWLLVDEAGQATPQAAVGALWRARRAVLVGDPLQLEPIVTVADAVLEHMRSCYEVDNHWLPNRQSAQTLADQATPWGRMAGPSGQKCWVGLPLVVHRRCDAPMFELANRIAYDGAMVYGTRAPSAAKETPARLLTGWLHASGRSSGNWVDEEGRALTRLLARLQEEGVDDNSIAVITPFQDVRNNLAELLAAKTVYGTIHTMQGKEAAVVILVLGGNSETDGARNWAVSQPNLLNVAATRAKRRLYVIGDRHDWQQRKLFCDVMDLLPVHPPLEVRGHSTV